jgi:serine/threonine protein kinase
MNPAPNREVVLFSAALELPAGQRAAYLADACADDSALRLRLEALLRVHEEAITFLERQLPGAPESPIGAAVTGATLRITAAPPEQAGDHIGRYKLLQQIGEGGCGIVYMADQEEPVRRRVALKVIKLGMDTKQVIGRFEAERQALALMDHPNIAKVLDGGATDAGRPFFVMELVRGIKITSFCDENNLSTGERLKLFMQVCRAIQHAHQKGVIHRDIKPSNILVADHDGVPVPKVIDFGVAKATTGQHLTDKTVFTAFEQFIGTPAYMSPEQAKFSGLDVDTRTDIYALGVLLYELLTGKTPLDHKELLAAGLEVMRRTICEKDPPRPSTRLSTMLESELTTTAKHRRIEPPKLVHLLRGDLDWIVMKALEKERGRRYETANGLAMDIERHLNNEPVVARPPSKRYLFQKLVRRNKLVFAAGAVIFASLVIGLVVSNWFFVQEKAARRRAIAAEEQAQAINRFLTEDLLFQATPEQNAREKKVTMEEVLQNAERRLDESAEIAQQPQLKATLRLAFGTTYFKLSALDEAERNLRPAFTWRRNALGPQNLETLKAEHQLAEFLISGRSDHEEGGQLAREVWQARCRLLGAENRDTLRSRELCCSALVDAGNFEGARPFASELLQIRERVLGPDDLDTISSLGTLGQLLSVSGAYADAEPYFQEALKRYHRRGLDDQRDAMMCAKELAFAHLIQGDPVEANKILTELVPRAARILGSNAMFTLQFSRVRARALAEEGRLPEAEALAEEILALRRSQTSDVRGNAYTLLYLGRFQVQRGELAQAEPHLQDALKIFREHLATKPDLAAQAANWLGAILVARKDYTNAEKLLLSGADQILGRAAEMSPNERRLALSNIFNLYQAWGRPDQAAVWQKKLDQLAETQALKKR